MPSRKQKRAIDEAAKKGTAHHAYVVASHDQQTAEAAGRSHGVRWTLQLVAIILVVGLLIGLVGLWLGTMNRSASPASPDPFNDNRFDPSRQIPANGAGGASTPLPSDAGTTPESSSNNTVQVGQPVDQ